MVIVIIIARVFEQHLWRRSICGRNQSLLTLENFFTLKSKCRGISKMTNFWLATVAASFLVLASCDAQVTSDGRDDHTTQAEASVPTPVDRIRDGSKGQYLSAEQISSYLDRLQRDEFSTTSDHERDVSSIDNEIAKKGDLFSIFYSEMAGQTYNADSGEMTYGFLISEEAVSGLGSDVTSVVFSEFPSPPRKLVISIPEESILRGKALMVSCSTLSI